MSESQWFGVLWLAIGVMIYLGRAGMARGNERFTGIPRQSYERHIRRVAAVVIIAGILRVLEVGPW